MQNKLLKITRMGLALIAFGWITPAVAVGNPCSSMSEDLKSITPQKMRSDLKNGLDATARFADGLTMLHLAAPCVSNPEVIAVLLQAGASINARDVDGMTALHNVAEWNTDPKATIILLEAGADVHALDKHGNTPLHRAAKENKNSDVIMALLDAGANGKIKNKEGKTPFNYAQDNWPLKDTKAYWALSDTQF